MTAVTIPGVTKFKTLDDYAKYSQDFWVDGVTILLTSGSKGTYDVELFSDSNSLDPITDAIYMLVDDEEKIKQAVDNIEQY
jgi:hypothetical protein